MTIELDLEERYRSIISEAGANYIGQRAGLVWFTDPVTKSTHVLEPRNVTVEAVELKLKLSRDTFSNRNDIHRAVR